MKKISLNLKKGELKVKVESSDDLLALKFIVNKGDKVTSKTERKIKIGNKEERSRSVTKTRFLATLSVEKTEFVPESSQLRISGKMIDAPSDIPKGSYHTITINIMDTLTITKETWLKFQLKKLQDACKPTHHSILLLVFDREEALFARIKSFGYETLRTLSGEVPKKRMVQTIKVPFFERITQSLKELSERHKFSHIIIASPGFWKDEIKPYLEKVSFRQKIFFASCSSVGTNGISEVLKRPEIVSALKEERFLLEINAVEELMAAISKEDPSVYGLKDVSYAAEAGAISKLLVVDSFLQEKADKIDLLLKKAESQKGEIIIISSIHEGGKKLLGVGGIGAILRYKLYN